MIVDDERHARAEMRRLLAAHPEIEIVGEAASASEGLKIIAKMRPDVLFLDIQMPKHTGFDLVSQLSAPLPHLIFTTAYDEYALRAFEVNALAYLLKPIEPVRLANALKRLGDVPLSSPLSTSAEALLKETDQVFIREDDRCWFVPVREISLLESEGNHTRIHVREARPMIYRSLNALEERLPQSLFFRANRSQIINFDWIESIENWFSGGLKVKMKDGAAVEMSRRQAVAFRERKAL